jgi:hypothetical protein
MRKAATKKGPLGGGETQGNIKRTEVNMKKLKAIELNDRRIDSFSPQINLPLKKPLYDQEYIRRYLVEKGLAESQSVR